jgi:hypothetical protein
MSVVTLLRIRADPVVVQPTNPRDNEIVFLQTVGKDAIKHTLLFF